MDVRAVVGHLGAGERVAGPLSRVLRGAEKGCNSGLQTLKSSISDPLKNAK